MTWWANAKVRSPLDDIGADSRVIFSGYEDWGTWGCGLDRSDAGKVLLVGWCV